MKKLMPGKGRLLLELDRVEERKISEHLIAPDLHSEMSRRAKVLAVGKPSIPEDEGEFKVGDTVMISRHTGLIVLDFELKWYDDTHRICRYGEVLGKME